MPSGRGSYNKKKKQSGGKGSSARRFRGRTPGLEGRFVYERHHANLLNQVNQFHATTEAISNHLIHHIENARDIVDAIRNLKVPTIEVGSKPPTPLDDLTMKEGMTIEEFKLSIDECISYDRNLNRKRNLERNLVTLFRIVHDQCSPDIQVLLEGFPDVVANKNDGIALLKAVKEIMYGYPSKRYLPLATMEALELFHRLQQGRTEASHNFKKRLLNAVDLVDYVAGDLLEWTKNVSRQLAGEGNEITEEHKKMAQEQCLAAAPLLKANSKYDELRAQLANDFFHGKDHYPKTMMEAYRLLSDWVPPYKR